MNLKCHELYFTTFPNLYPVASYCKLSFKLTRMDLTHGPNSRCNLLGISTQTRVSDIIPVYIFIGIL